MYNFSSASLQMMYCPDCMYNFSSAGLQRMHCPPDCLYNFSSASPRRMHACALSEAILADFSPFLHDGFLSFIPDSLMSGVGNPNPDPFGSGAFCRIRLCVGNIHHQIRIRPCYLYYLLKSIFNHSRKKYNFYETNTIRIRNMFRRKFHTLGGISYLVGSGSVPSIVKCRIQIWSKMVRTRQYC
jgi:hypothetical protein